MTPRVLLAPEEIAGQLALSAHGLRLAGVPATAYAPRHPFDYGVGPDVLRAAGHVRPQLQWLELVATHDIVHFFFARSFLPPYLRFLDARLIARLPGKRVLVTFCGSDIRRPAFERARNPHYVQIPGEEDGAAEDRLRRWAAITGGHAVVQDPELLAHVEPFFAHPHLLPVMVDTTRYAPAPPDPRTRRPVVVHSPTSTAGKGTDHVRAAVQELERRGLEFEYREVQGLPQAQALEVYARADLVVDQLCCGSYGVFAIEAMSLAKPVIGHVGVDRDRFPADLPIIQADPTTITEVLADWIGRPQDRRELGLRGRDFAERVHDVRVVGRSLADLYGTL